MRKTMLAFAVLLTPLCVQDPQDANKPAPTSAASVPQVGDAVPAFRLNDHTGRAVAIGGKSTSWTVVAFYPKAATPG